MTQTTIRTLVRLHLFIIIFALVAGCGDGGGGESASVPAGTTLSASILSSQVGDFYNLYVYLPVGYETSQDSYPIIYALDGGWRFSTMVRVLNVMGAKVILVAIGREDRRATDYLLPGAQAYYNFIALELIPFIESQYRVRANSRAIAGHSLGGLFVGEALFMDRLGGQYFANFISQDGSFFLKMGAIWAMEQQVFDSSNGQLPVSLVVSGARCCNYQLASDFYDRVVSRNYQGLNAHKLPSYPLDHVGMFAPSFEDSVRILFP